MFIEYRCPLEVRTGNFVDLESAALLKAFCQDFKQDAPYPETISQAEAFLPELFLFNSTLEEFEESSLILLVGSNLR